MAKSRRAQSARLPYFAQNFSAQALLAGLASRHHAPGRGQDVNSQSTQHARDVIPPHVYAASGPRDALQVGDGGGIIRAVLQVNAQDIAVLLLCRLEVGDV